MTAEECVGRLAGLVVSLGIGAAILTGGLCEAAADPADSAAPSDTAGSHAAERDDTTGHGSSQDESRAAGAEDSDRQEPQDSQSDDDDDNGDIDVEPDTRRLSTTDGARSAVRRSSTIHSSENEAPAPTADDSPSAPLEAQALTATVATARRESTLSSTVAETAQTSNTPPAVTASVARPDPLSGVARVTVTAADPDGDLLTYTATRPGFGRIAGDGNGNFTYTPTSFARVLARVLPFIRSDRFSVNVSDGQGATTSVKVTTAIVPVNAAPKAGTTTVNAAVPSTGVVTGRTKASDPNRDTLTYLATTIVTDKGSVAVNSDGSFTYTPNLVARHRAAATSATAADRSDAFQVTVSDKFGAATAIPITVSISGFNSAPTGTAAFGSPDAISGSVTGTVTAFDVEGDSLTFGGSTTTRKGAVVVAGDGVVSYTPSDAARYYASHTYATPYDRTDTFAVTVDDGHGGRTTIPVTVVIGPGSLPTTAPPLSTFCGCTLMPANTIFHADLRGLQAMPESDTWISLLGGGRGATLHSGWAGDEWMGSTAGMPVNVVSADRPKEDVVFNRGYSTSGPGIDDRPYAIPDRPLVEGMPSYPAWDRHLLVFQEGTCISQELYNVANGVELPGAGILDILGNAVYASIWGSTWIAEAGAQYDMSSPLYPAIGHANASRLPYLPMILRPDDLDRGYIDHMLGIVIAKDLGAGYVWPARAGDGSASDGIPMGTVLRLRSDIDIAAYAPATQIVLRALQVHGAVIYDSGTPGGEGAGLLAMSNGWSGTDYVTARSELNTIPIEFFEAVDAASLAVDPATSWQVRG